MAWTDDRVEMLKKLWADGLSASQIAQKLGGVTRNAVIGKVHRLGLSGRATPSRPVRLPVRAASRPKRTAAKTTSTPAAKEAAPPPAPIEPKRLPNGDYVSVLTLSNQTCKWPVGDPDDPDFRFCGRRAENGSPYCEGHKQQAYQPQKKRRRRNSDAESILNSLAANRRAS